MCVCVCVCVCVGVCVCFLIDRPKLERRVGFTICLHLVWEMVRFFEKRNLTQNLNLIRLFHFHRRLPLLHNIYICVCVCVCW